MPERIQLVTSIAPRNIENQQQAVQSWLRLGFSVTSLNVPSEISDLKPFFEGVEFHAVSRDARADCGRPLVYLDDVFTFLREKGTPVCGLINSDIHLRASPATIDFVVAQAREAVVLACRTDLDSLSDPVGVVYRHGFDVFLFDKKILEFLPTTPFCLGQPWWDYWFPASILFKSPRSYPLKLLVFPFALHIRHASNWNHDDNFVKYGMHFAQIIEPHTHRSFLAQSPEKREESIGTYSGSIAITILLRCQWLSYLPENGQPHRTAV